MNFSKAAFLLSLSGFSFAFGLMVGAYEIFPYKHIRYVLNSVEAVVADRRNLLTNMPVYFLENRRYEGNSVTVYDRAQTRPGYTLLSGFFGDMPGIQLIDMEGTVIRSWPTSFYSIIESTDHIVPKSEIPASDWNAAVHGVEISPDGSVVFNLDGKGTAKLDKCGNPIWIVRRMNHHSLEQSADGSYWIPSRHWVENESDAHALFQAPYRDDTLLRVSADGQVLSEISLVEILIDNGLFSLLDANGRFETEVREEDVLHFNDIEELGEEYADAFPLFSAGDLLVSLRHLNTLLVVDPVNWKVKWYQSGPWLRQHDPDFQPDGSISVFNNNSDDTNDGGILGGSNLMSVRPHLPGRSVDILYGDQEGQHFYTNAQGKHQVLDNGNLLIVEYSGGRVFEVNPSGDIVWQFVNGYDQENVAKLSGGERYAEEYFDVRDWSCSTD